MQDKNRIDENRLKTSSALSLVVSDNFDVFWNLYPKKVGKDAAYKSWQKTKANIDDVIQAIQWQKQSEQWKRENGKYIPNPATYLNQGRWKDDEMDKQDARPVIRQEGA